MQTPEQSNSTLRKPTVRSRLRRRAVGQSEARDTIPVVAVPLYIERREPGIPSAEELPRLLASVCSAMGRLRGRVPSHARRLVEWMEWELERSRELAERYCGVDSEQRRCRHLARLARRYPMLSRRELEICAMIGEGKCTKRIAGEIHTSVRNVEQHRYRIRRKLGLDTGESLAVVIGRDMS